MKTKSPTGSASGSVALFDFAARREFITGASKRKEQRRKEAQARALEKQKEERRLLRAQRREKIREHINYVRRSQQLAEAASGAVTSLHKKPQKSVGLDSRTNGREPKRGGDAADTGWKATETQPAREGEVVQAVRLLPPPAADASSSPWQIASCVSLSRGSFIEAPAEAGAAASAVRTPLSLQTKHEGAGSSKEKQQQSVRTSVTPQVAVKSKKRPEGAPKGARAGSQKHQKKRHKSRRPQRRRSKRR